MRDGRLQWKIGKRSLAKPSNTWIWTPPSIESTSPLEEESFSSRECDWGPGGVLRTAAWMRSGCSRISGHVEGTLVCPRQFPPPVPAGASHGYGKIARQHPTRWIAGQSERTTENWGDLTGRFPPPRTARSGDPGTVGADVLLAMAEIAARQGTGPPGAAGFLRRFLGPYYHL